MMSQTNNTFSVELPDGTTLTDIPEGTTKSQIAEKLGTTVEWLDNYREATEWEKFSYEFQQGSNLTTNIGDYAKSHFPFLSTEFTLNSDGDFQIMYPEDLYGEDVYDLDPQQRRERMKEVDARNLQQEYEYVDPANTGAAGVAGAITKAVADPTALLPAGKALQGAKSVYEAAKGTAKVGAAWGAAYGASEQLSEKGVPTTTEEAVEGAKRVAGGAVAGAVGGAVLGPVGYGGKKALEAWATRGLSSPEKAAKFGMEKYYPEIWRNQAVGMSSAEAQTAIRSKYKLSLEDEWKVLSAVRKSTGDFWRKAGQGNKYFWTVADNSRDAVGRLQGTRALDFGDPVLASKGMQLVDNVIRPLSSAIKDVNPRVAGRLVRMEGELLRNIELHHQEMRPFIKHWRSIDLPRADRIRLGKALYNGDFNHVRNIFSLYGKPGAVEAFDQSINTLSIIHKQMKDSGIKIQGKVLNYFPRVIKDIEGLMKHLEKGNYPKGLDRYLSSELKKLKGQEKLTEGQKIELINRWMQMKPGVYKEVGSRKQRGIVEITDDLIQFYDDPITSLDLHLREAISAIERRKFFGKHMKTTNSGLENLRDSVGAYVDTKATDAASRRLKELLLARFGGGEKYGWRGLNTMRQGIGGFTLGNPYSAIKQFGDIPVVAVRYGIVETLKSMPEATLNTIKGQLGIKTKTGIDADAFGLTMDMAQELDTGKVAGNLIKKTSNALYRYGGFKTVDRLGKNVLMTTAFRKHQRMARSVSGKKRLLQEFGNLYSPEEMVQLLDDLEKGKITDLVKAHVFSELTGIQPVSKSQMSKAYLDHPNARMFWQFRTWGMRQLDLARDMVWRNILSGDPVKQARGLRALGLFYMYVGAANVGLTEAQRMLVGRDGKLESFDQLPEEALWSLLANFSFDRYSFSKSAQTGDFSGVWSGFAPPALEIPANSGFAAYNAAIAPPGSEEREKWAKKIFTNMFTIARMIDFWFLGGAEEANEKQEKQKMKEFTQELNRY